MPLKDGANAGTNADGTPNDRFCKNCYQSGQFTEPNITVTQMQDKVQGIMKGMHFPGFMAKWFTKSIPNLERWKK